MKSICLAGLLAAAAALSASPRQREKARRPNVVILFTDDQGTLDANCFGSNDLRTPNIDRLAKTGVRFTAAYAHTVCCPSRAALLTGRHPQRSGVNSWMQGDLKGPDGLNMALGEITLAETLKAAGYRTALFGKWHLGAHRDHGPMKQGFDEFFGIRDGFIDNYNHYFLHGGKGYHDLYEGTKEVTRKGDYFPEMVVDRSLEFIEKNRDRPFFLYLAFNIPHYPEQALKEHSSLYEKLPMPRRSYAAIVTTTDHYIGKVLDQLDKLDLRRNTIVIFQSDNGHSTERYSIRSAEHTSGYPKGHRYGANGGGGNTGKWIGNKGNFLEGGIRTPAIISYPTSLPQGETRSQVVSIMDWYPTVLELCKVEPPKATLDGHSLLPVLANAGAASKHETLYFQWQQRWAVRQGGWKLIGTGNRKGKENLSLHLLTGEKPERKNHAAEKPAIVKRLQALYRAWKKGVTPTPK